MLRNPRSSAIVTWVSISNTEPREMERNWLNARSEKRPLPSAMLLATDIAALRNWLVGPNISARGKLSVLL